MKEETHELAGATGRLVLLGPIAVPGFDAPERRLRVYLPPERRRGGRTVFLFDGQNVFDDAPSFAGGWHAHVVVDRIARRSRSAPVVVGLDHGGVARLEELSPWPVMGKTGRLDQLLAWIGAEAAPLLASRFGATLRAEHAVVGGSSMGGLAALYAHLVRPDLFGGAIAMSPSFFVGQGAIARVIESTPKPWRSRVYIDAGAREARGRLVEVASRAAEALTRRGWGASDVKLRRDAKGTHDEAAWRRRFPAALRWTLGISGK